MIGRYTSLPRDLLVINGSHPVTHRSCHPFFFNPDLGYVDKLLIEERTELFVGNDVYIGLNVTILPSVVSIGDGAVVGAASVVTKDAPLAVVAGNPAKLVKYRFSPETIESIAASRWWEKDIDELKADELQFAAFLTPLKSFRFPVRTGWMRGRPYFGSVGEAAGVSPPGLSCPSFSLRRRFGNLGVPFPTVLSLPMLFRIIEVRKR